MPGIREGVAAALYAQTTTETFGRSTWSANGTCSQACCSFAAACFSSRSIRRDAKPPIVDLRSTSEPVVGEREDNRTSQAMLKHFPNVACEQFALPNRSFANCVHSELTQHERPISCDMLQAIKICTQAFEIVQINVEAAKVKPGRL